MSADMILQVKDVSKRFGGLQALTDITFDLPQGQILGLIGPNGAGKTTLFNVINGVYPPERGQVFFRSKDITRLPSYEVARLGLSRAHQVVRPLTDLSVRENVMVGACFGWESHGLRAAHRLADEGLTYVGLMDRADQPAGSLMRSLPFPGAPAQVVLPAVYVNIIVMPQEPDTTCDGDTATLPSPIMGVKVGVMVGVAGTRFMTGLTASSVVMSPSFAASTGIVTRPLPST